MATRSSSSTSSSSSKNCDKYGTLKSKIRDHLRAFSLLSRFNSDLKPEILIQHIQKILDENEEPDDEISIVHENDAVVGHQQLYNAFTLLSDFNPDLDQTIFHTSLQNLFKIEDGTSPKKPRVVKKEKRPASEEKPSPDFEIVALKSKRRPRENHSETPNPLSILPAPDSEFLDNLPFIPWGNNVNENSLYKFTNTCTIDNGLMALTLLFKFFPPVLQYFQDIADSPNPNPNPKLSNLATDILNLIGIVESKEDYNAAKTMWIQNICKTFKKPLIEASTSDGHLNCLWGSEDEMFLRPLKKLMQKYVEIQKCKKHGIVIKEELSPSNFAKGRMQDIANFINLQFQSRELKCTQKDCTNEIIRKTELIQGCEPLPFQVFHVHDETEVDAVPKVIQILDTEYQLFCASMFSESRNHFFAAFDWNGVWITYDGTKDKFQQGLLPYDYISLLWYIRK